MGVYSAFRQQFLKTSILFSNGIFWITKLLWQIKCQKSPSSAIVGISVDNELDLLRISVPEYDDLIDDLVNENPNLSGLIDLDVFNSLLLVQMI